MINRPEDFASTLTTTTPHEKFIPANTSSNLVSVKPIGQVTKIREMELSAKYPHYKPQLNVK